MCEKNDKIYCIICNKYIKEYVSIYMCCDSYTCSLKCSYERLAYILNYDKSLSHPSEWNECKSIYSP
jgi:hypothetical protein